MAKPRRLIFILHQSQRTLARCQLSLSRPAEPSPQASKDHFWKGFSDGMIGTPYNHEEALFKDNRKVISEYPDPWAIQRNGGSCGFFRADDVDIQCAIGGEDSMNSATARQLDALVPNGIVQEAGMSQKQGKS